MRNRLGFNIILYDNKKVGLLKLLPFKQDFLTKFIDGKVVEKDGRLKRKNLLTSIPKINYAN